MGGENDLRGFDIRSVSPVAFLPSVGAIALRNPERNSGLEKRPKSSVGRP